ncbi:unnamed protein product [Rotaria sp. Silwood2]|nr:unnamed protein product [Rotaria sp. Silwood2]CAF2532307.1 unnamed protein product [Rotaria sp. Silwood2]CAF2784285.1 unnamed protein product [Rotaria sp. Silwood2]CAF3870621.1 unnamed protein product [Rotaria sp. Silwood2]CAF3891854.1 unnamed protein product [Rotaria sp. Silwood2]
MISLTLWLFLWSCFFVLAPSSLNINHSRSLVNLTLKTPNLFNNNSEIFMKQRKMKINRTKSAINYPYFDINSYRSSWIFVDKRTLRVRFRLYESLLHSIVSTHFLVRHTRTNQVRIYDEQNEIINSTLTLYLHNIKHGRHTVCLLLYTSKLMKNPKHIFCQDIIFNFHKYGHQDIDSDEYGNTFFFLLTQYAIVLGILCILQLVHAARKRRFLKTVYDKANALLNFMTENHHHLQENKSTIDLNNQTHSLEYLIYNLNRHALYNLDELQMQPTNENNVKIINNSSITDQRRKGNQKHLKLPNRLNEHVIIPLLEHRRRTIATTINNNFHLNDEDFYENYLDIPSNEEQSTSFQSLSHILEANKPWMTRLTDNGNMEHSILTSKPL